MNINIRCAIAVVLTFCVCACETNEHNKKVSSLSKLTPVIRSQPISIAFMPDVHFHDVYGQFESEAFKGLPVATEAGSQQATIRSMQSQLQSTRLFNENYFAFIAALDDVVKRKIKIVALPGDFSDDGQPLHIRGLKKVLDKYHNEYGIEFFATNGNHDPTRPFTHPAGKQDYLGEFGQEQPIFSRDHINCLQKKVAEKNSSDASTNSKEVSEKKIHSIICSDDVQELGYQPILDMLGQHGFYPQENYRYFETPYSTYTTANYSFAMAKQQAAFENRQYEICGQGAGGIYKKIGYTDCRYIPDSSYLVEPIEGVWLLAIDANVYEPRKYDATKNDQSLPKNNLVNETYLGSGDAGYNKVISHKTHLLNWICDLVKRAEAEHKTLIAFSHFPMEDFYDGASDDIESLFGKGKFQLNRKPTTHTSNILASTGLKVHVGGHMHMNDTGVYKGDTGNVLFNIQAPSLAAYAPAYKILTLKDKQIIEVETAVVKDVPRFNELFPLYEQEWNYLHSIHDKNIWDENILDSKNYYEYTSWHLKELARLRFYPQEWPLDLRTKLNALSGRDLLVISQLQRSISLQELETLRSNNISLPSKDVSNELFSEWNAAVSRAEKISETKKFTLEDFSKWSGGDFSLDFYRICNAEQLAIKDIGIKRIEQYELLAKEFSKYKYGIENNDGVSDINLSKLFKERLSVLFSILLQLTNGEPNDHFLLNIKSGNIIDIK